MTDRDAFAAAALTGLLATGQGPYHGEDYFAKAAYKAADAMLAERAKTNHYAVPAARADLSDERPPNAVSANGGTPCAASRDGSGSGNTPEPVAWAVATPDRMFRVLAFSRQRAVEERLSASEQVVPLYAHPPQVVRLPKATDDLEISEANGYAAAMRDICAALTAAGVKWEVADE